MWLLYLALGCAPDSPTRAEDCAWLLDGNSTKTCMTKVALATFKTDPVAGVAFTETQIPEQLERDFIYLQVVQEMPAADPELCKKISSATFKENCVTAASRPHLQTAPGDGPRGAPPHAGARAPESPR